MSSVDFVKLVADNWSIAVFEASANLEGYRSQLIEGLHHSDPEVRSAAVASLNEANDASAHDEIVALISDNSHLVQDEVLEYLLDFGSEDDASLVFDFLERGRHEFLASSILLKLFPDQGEVFDEDDSIEHKNECVAEWRRFLQERDSFA